MYSGGLAIRKTRKTFLNRVKDWNVFQRYMACIKKPSGLLQRLKVLGICQYGLHRSNTQRGGCDAVEVFVDRLSKMMDLAALKTDVTEKETARLFRHRPLSCKAYPGK